MREDDPHGADPGWFEAVNTTVVAKSMVLIWTGRRPRNSATGQRDALLILDGPSTRSTTVVSAMEADPGQVKEQS